MDTNVKALAAIAAQKMSALLKKKSTSDEFIMLQAAPTDADQITLSSALQCPSRDDDLYITSSSSKNAFTLEDTEKPDEDANVMSSLEKGLVAPPIHVTKSMKAAAKRKAKEIHDTAGPKWFDLPATPITPELKKDLRLLQMRSILDPKRFYKANDSKSLPKYFHVGTFVDNASEFFTDGANKKARKDSLVDQILKDTEKRKYFKKKFTAVQQDKAKFVRPKKSFKKHGHGKK